MAGALPAFAAGSFKSKVQTWVDQFLSSKVPCRDSKSVKNRSLKRTPCCDNVKGDDEMRLVELPGRQVIPGVACDRVQRQASTRDQPQRVFPLPSQGPPTAHRAFQFCESIMAPIRPSK